MSIMVSVKGHPLFPEQQKTVNKQAHRYRVVMAEHLGRPLLSSEIVHHKDENNENDVIENLEITTRPVHVSHHKKGKPTGLAAWNKGLSSSAETKEKQRIAKLGTKRSEESKQKASISLKANHAAHPRTVSAETRAKISATNKAKGIKPPTPKWNTGGPK